MCKQLLIGIILALGVSSNSAWAATAEGYLCWVRLVAHSSSMYGTSGHIRASLNAQKDCAGPWIMSNQAFSSPGASEASSGTSLYSKEHLLALYQALVNASLSGAEVMFSGCDATSNSICSYASIRTEP